jgi:oxalate decarboxylase/phosphoglucose isomerase-like protein (cupin superfamily)
MHWHDSAEWAYIAEGHCQMTVVDPDGQLEVVNLDPGDLWYFPKGHGHAIQTLGPAPCHAILAFDEEGRGSRLFARDKRVAVAELSPGECAYIPRNCGHSIQNVGSEDAEIVGALDSGAYHESSLSDWLAKAPRHLLANNFGIAEQAVASFGKKRMVIAPSNPPA